MAKPNSSPVDNTSKSSVDQTARALTLKMAGRGSKSVSDYANLRQLNMLLGLGENLSSVHKTGDYAFLKSSVDRDSSKASLLSYSDFLSATLANFTEVSKTFQNWGTSGSTVLTPTQWLLSTSNCSITTSLTSIDTSYLSLTAKQTIQNSSFYHATSDLYNVNARYLWQRAEEETSLTTGDYLVYAEKGTEQFYKHSRILSGDAFSYGDAYQIQSGYTDKTLDFSSVFSLENLSRFAGGFINATFSNFSFSNFFDSFSNIFSDVANAIEDPLGVLGFDGSKVVVFPSAKLEKDYGTVDILSAADMQILANGKLSMYSGKRVDVYAKRGFLFASEDAFLSFGTGLGVASTAPVAVASGSFISLQSSLMFLNCLLPVPIELDGTNPLAKFRKVKKLKDSDLPKYKQNKLPKSAGMSGVSAGDASYLLPPTGNVGPASSRPDPGLGSVVPSPSYPK